MGIVDHAAGFAHQLVLAACASRLLHFPFLLEQKVRSQANQKGLRGFKPCKFSPQE